MEWFEENTFFLLLLSLGPDSIGALRLCAAILLYNLEMKSFESRVCCT